MFIPFPGGSVTTGNVAPNDFIGREKELSQITYFVDNHHPKRGKIRTAAIVILLYGLPVVGKSALARRLVCNSNRQYVLCAPANSLADGRICRQVPRFPLPDKYEGGGIWLHLSYRCHDRSDSFCAPNDRPS